MKYKLLNNNDEKDPIIHVLMNRGIQKEEIAHYLNTTDKDINDYKLLGEENLKAAAAALGKTVQENKKAIVIIDSDVDGLVSAAFIINYLYNLFPSWVENNLDWIMHEGKQHGLEDHISALLDCDYSLVIVPDGGSNNYKEHKELKEDGTTVIVLDHHEAEKISEDAIIINNQLSDYPNKELSGVGVVWQFCRYLDDLMGNNYADDYIDLVALGLVADMMSLTSLETKHLVQKGFKEENLKNPFIYGMRKKNAFSIGDTLTPMGAAFYIAPFINAIVRSGTMEEKKLIFESMLEFKSFDEVLSTKRGHKLGETEKIWEQALRVAVNVKRRQTKSQDEGMDLLENMIKEQNLLNHKVLLFLLEPNQVDANIRGLVANKFMAKYQRPCCILTKTVECGTDKNKKHIKYQGSARGYDKSGVTNFKDICESAPGVLYAQGHQGAFGLGISEGVYETPEDYEILGETIHQFIDYMDNKFKDVSSEPIYSVDYIYEGANVDAQIILTIGGLKDLWGKDVDEPYIAIKGLKLTKEMIEIYKRKTNTIKIKLPNGISIMKFLATEEECKLFQPDGYIELDIVGRCDINEWNGNTYPQILIDDYEVIDKCKYYF